MVNAKAVKSLPFKLSDQFNSPATVRDYIFVFDTKTFDREQKSLHKENVSR